MGELIQIDHMTVSRDGQTLKEFRAVCPISRLMVSRVFSRATAGNAARFLDHVVRDMPFPTRSIQVDGGSEIQAQFEDACKAREKRLHVLPPRRQQWNGCVERHNDTARIKFWNLIPAISPAQTPGAARRLPPFFFGNVRTTEDSTWQPHGIRCQPGCLTTSSLICLESAQRR